MCGDDGYRSSTSIFKHSKKAQAAPEAQFNWIFILIVGAIIIAFFTVIVLKQKSASEVQVSGTLTKQLNTVFMGAKVSSGTVQVVSTPKFAVRFACNDYYLGAASQRLGNRIIFAPENFEGRDVITWTLDWSNPYKIGTFLYVTNSNVRYILVDAGAEKNDVDKLNVSLPMKLNRNENIIDYDTAGSSEYMSLSPLAENSVRFVFLGNEAPTTPMGIPPAYESAGKSISGVYINPTTGKIYFLDNNLDIMDNNGFQFIDYESMLGAIFSDNPSIYECVMDRAYTNWNIVNQVMMKKMELIKPMYSGTVCDSLYDTSHFEEINTSTYGKNPFSEKTGPNLGSAIQGIRNINGQAQLSSCPLLY